MTDAEFMALMHKLHVSKRRGIIADLLAGNDTQCFTTEQYMVRMFAKVRGDYERAKAAGWCKPVFEHDYWHGKAREQLAEELREVGPDLWAPKITEDS